ncbi:MAG: thioredoxin domain-containing protein [Actinobacteria bacterium]|nr:thioredoxin domain-containing protein [Actinomycetota bacterium]
MANHLLGETSPYLLQHAANPVDWYPWGSEALDKAEREGKPIFLSIGYSSCHWCHVMEKESFSDAHVAAELNRLFISIKVDREERPDLDEIYMRAVTTLTGSGGWPLSVWLTPKGVPFHGGTYFPPSPRFGMPSFRQVFLAVAEVWRTRREDVERSAGDLLAHLSEDHAVWAPGAGPVHDEALGNLAGSYDPVHGGWGEAPKFPPPILLEYLLMRHSAHAEAGQDIEQWVNRTLEAMAFGGINDQLRGGFHRYSTDERWLVPHFEKMLYDNAQIARCYLHAWQLLGRNLYRRISEKTLEYLIAEMRHGQGGFFSSQDADSEGEEGRFFLWSLSEIEELLTVDDAVRARKVFGLSAGGNFEGRNVLWLAEPPETPADADRYDRIRDTLLQARERRTRPARDEKILAAWNGLTLSTFAEAARALDSPRYREIATGLAEFLAGEMMGPDFRCSRSWKDGHRAGRGYLEDYASLAEGFLALYQATFDERWFVTARGLIERILADFGRPEGGFYDTSIEHEDLLVRPRSLQDSPTPCGNSLAVTVLLKMAAYTGEERYWDAAAGTLERGSPPAGRVPGVFGQWLCAQHLAETGLTEVAIVGKAGCEATEQLISAVAGQYLPTVVTAARSAGGDSAIAVLDQREPPAGLEATAWVCRGQACLPQTGDPTELLRQVKLAPEP